MNPIALLATPGVPGAPRDAHHYLADARLARAQHRAIPPRARRNSSSTSALDTTAWLQKLGPTVPKEQTLRHMPSIVAENRFEYARVCGGEAWLVGEHPDAVDRTQSLKWSKVAWARHALQFFPSVEYVLWVHPARFERTIS